MNIPPPSIGTLMPLTKIWSEFVEIVVEITIEAYYQLDKEQCAKATWLENTFTAALTPRIGEAARQRKCGLAIVPQVPLHTEAMREGQEDPKHAKQPDILIFHPDWGNPHSIYFTWEAKRVGDAEANSKHKKLNRAYIKDGMRRFIDGEYSSYVTASGMLGYVIYGNGDVIADQVNDLMIERGLTTSDYLQPFPPVGSFTNIYLSHHARIGLKEVTIYHLMLGFNFTSPVKLHKRTKPLFDEGCGGFDIRLLTRHCTLLRQCIGRPAAVG